MQTKIAALLAVVACTAALAVAAATWTVVPSPNRGTVSSLLNGVAVLARNDAWAAGHSYDRQLASYRTFIQHWDGTRWRIVATPNVGTDYNDLNAVAAANQSVAWAVGYSKDSTTGNSRTLILHWDGTAWSVVPSPNPGPGYNTLYGVSVVSPGEAWAVGWYYDASFVGRPLVLHWNGTKWNMVAAPGASTYVNVLLAVAASGPADAWAGGYAYVNHRYTTLLEHWNGSTWTVVPSPNVGTSHNLLRGVSAVSPLEAWAVGESSGSGSLVEHWDGTAWSVVTHPVPSGTHTFWGVSAVQTTDVWAAGYVNDSSGVRPLIEHWDGAVWQQQAAATTPPDSWLTAIAGVPAGDVWAVGETGVSTLTMSAGR